MFWIVMWIGLLLVPVMAVLLVSVAVMMPLPAVLSLAVNVPVPLAKVLFAGITPIGSLLE